MASAPWVKYDDGTEKISSNCFPVRSLIRQAEDGGGAWLVEQRAEQRRRFKAVLCAKPRTYSRIKEERKKAERDGTELNLAVQSLVDEEDEEEEEISVLDGFFLMKHCCVEDPIDLCSVNIAGQELSEVKEEDFALFDNVAYVNASENYLPFEAFRGFPIIRELELSLNGLRNIKLQQGDYPSLEMVDVSYNNLSHEDLLSLGTLPNLKILHLTGNNFRSLPQEFALPHIDKQSKHRILRYSKLEILMLDENKLSDVRIFAALAGLKRLKHLNLEKNELFYVPQLKCVEGTMIVNDDEKSTKRLQRSARKSARKSARSLKSDRSVKSVEKAISPDVTDKAPAKPPAETVDDNKSVDLGTEKPFDQNLSEKPVTEANDKESAKPEDQDLMNMDFGEDFGDIAAKLKDFDLNEINADETSSGDGGSAFLSKDNGGNKAPSLPPFPQLAYLNLAHNVIAEEEALLAVAAWPMLVELIVHNNPLTTERSGDPPLLKRFLCDRLGIKLVRKSDKGISKPEVKVPTKKSRKVSSIVPKIPKIPFEELLMLEAPKPPSAPKDYNSSGNHTINALDLNVSSPLPPIPPSAQYKRAFSGESRKSQEEGQDQDIPQPPVYNKLFSSPKPEEEEAGIPPSAQYEKMFKSPTPELDPSPGIPPSAQYEKMFKSPSPESVPEAPLYGRPFSATEEQQQTDDKGGSAFFMTQVDDQTAEDKQEVPKKRRQKKEKRKDKGAKVKTIDDKYKGYEILLDVEDDEDTMAPKDMQGSIRALKYALSHELVYRDSAARLDRVQKHVEPYQKWQMPPQVPRKTRKEKIDDVLANLKKRSTTEEANLRDVLNDRRKMGKDYPESKTLLQDIQSRYNAVRVSSMKEAREVKQALKDLQSLANKKEPVSVK